MALISTPTDEPVFARPEPTDQVWSTRRVLSNDKACLGVDSNSFRDDHHLDSGQSAQTGLKWSVMSLYESIVQRMSLRSTLYQTSIGLWLCLRYRLSYSPFVALLVQLKTGPVYRANVMTDQTNGWVIAVPNVQIMSLPSELDSNEYLLYIRDIDLVICRFGLFANCLWLRTRRVWTVIWQALRCLVMSIQLICKWLCFQCCLQCKMTIMVVWDGNHDMACVWGVWGRSAGTQPNRQLWFWTKT